MIAEREGEAPAVPLDGDRCPHCGASDAILNLLTSMTRYFACRLCPQRWEVAVVSADRSD